MANINLVKFLTAYYRIKPKDFDGIDGYSISEPTLESIIDQAMEIQKNPKHLEVLLADAIASGLWEK